MKKHTSRMLCKLVMPCRVCEGAFSVKVINVTQQIPSPTGQMGASQNHCMCGIQVMV